MAVLLAGDEHSAVWMRVKAHLQARLQTLRLQNDGIMDETKRNVHVGRIAECKALLGLEQGEPPATTDEG